MCQCTPTIRTPFCGKTGCENPRENEHMAQFSAVLAAVKCEREYQDKKWTRAHNAEQTLSGYLLVIESELEEAKKGFIKGGEGRNHPLHEILQIAAVCVAALQAHGLPPAPLPKYEP